MTSPNEASLEDVAADVRKVGEHMLMQVKATDTPPEEVRTLRACGSGLIEESYEVAHVLTGGTPRSSAKAHTLAVVYRQWREANPMPNNPFPPRTPSH